MDSWAAPVDIYCERLYDGLWAEPVNLLTNAAFLIAALALLRCYRRYHLKAPLLLGLIGLVALIGIGSAIFHSVATELAMLLDVVPIAIFLLCYIAYALRIVLGYSVIIAMAALTLFLLLGYVVSFIPDDYSLNGTISYAPAFLFLAAISAEFQQRMGTAIARYLWAALGFFVLSMTMRSVDILVCSSFALGAHFMWHIINGIVLFLVVKGLIKQASANSKMMNQ